MTAVSGVVLSGAVDSSLVAEQGTNRVYVWKGDVSPSDYKGASTDPVAAIPVVQDENACTFGYTTASLAEGTYTLAFTHDAANDVPTRADTLTFAGRRVVTVHTGSQSQSFVAARVIQVGPTRSVKTVRAANATAQDGDVIEIDAGTYLDDISVWRQDGVVLRGVGSGRAHLQAQAQIPFSSGNDQQNGKGIWVIQGTNIRIENIELSGASVPDGNGAGIRNEGRNLTVCGAYLHDNENGFLGGAYGTLTIEFSELANNGHGDVGRTHNIYVDDGSSDGDKLIFRNNYSHDVNIGHLLKTRARENHVLYNRLTDNQTGSSSYNIDVPNGGLTYVIGNVMQQGPDTDNPTMVAYGAEGFKTGRTNELYLVNNTMVNDLGSGAFVSTDTGTSTFQSTNNLFVGSGTLYQGVSAQARTNLQSASPAFVNKAQFDYRLTSSSPARDAGSSPGSANGISLTPQFQYVDPAKRAARSQNGTIDIGAYEF